MVDSKYHAHLNAKNVPWWTSSRFGLAIIGFFGFVNLYALRINMSVAMVCMVNHTAIDTITKVTESSANGHDSGYNHSWIHVDVDKCQSQTASGNKNSSHLEDGEFVWDKSVQGLILGSFFWGYLVSQVPGGWLADRFGGKRVFGWFMFLISVATLLTPLGARTHYIFLIVLRVICGIGSGVAFPAMHSLFGHWSPPLERSKLTGITYAGTQIGNVITLPLAGVLCRHGFDGGWPSIFYILGSLGIVWFFVWMLLVSDTPAKHKRISQVERQYIMHSLKDQAMLNKNAKIPWRKIFTSMPVWAIIVSNISCDWGGYALLTNIPSYINEVLKLDIQENGIYSAFPFLGFWAVITTSGIVADKIRSKNILSTVRTRKVFDFIGKVFPAIFLIALGYLDCTQTVGAIVLLTLGTALTGCQFTSFLINHIDIAPRYAGILLGLANSIAAVTGFMAPYVIGILTTERSREQWQVVFYIAAVVYVVGALFYMVFASGEVQSWARDQTSQQLPEQEILNGNFSLETPVGNNNVNIVNGV